MVVEKNASIMVASSTPQITINALLSCLARFSMRKIMRSMEPTPMWMNASMGLLRSEASWMRSSISWSNKPVEKA